MNSRHRTLLFIVLAVVLLVAGVIASNEWKAKYAHERTDANWSLIVPAITAGDHTIGDIVAPIQVVVYADYQCAFCGRFLRDTQFQLQEEFGDKIVIAYRHLPIINSEKSAVEAASSECVYRLGGNDAFWKYHDAILERTTSGGTGFALDALVPLAKELGLDESKFQDCLDSGKYAQHVKDDMSGGAAAGITGTPGSILIDATGNSQLLSGAIPYATIKSSIDVALAAK